MFHDVSADAIKGLSASEVLTRHLENAQLAHRQCLAKAIKEGADPVDRCNLTWGEVLVRYQAWGAHREPFQTAEAEHMWAKKWTKKQQEAFDSKLFH
jgi:hypothetical protein